MIRWQPIDSGFNNFFDNEEMFSLMKQNRFNPALDVYEDKNNVIVDCALAGFDPEKVAINVEDNVLTIEGKEEHKTEVDDKNYYKKEIRQGSFYRSIALPHPVLGGEARATFEKGILKVTLPKAEEAKPKTIKIDIKK